jgi:hypothetical protein
VPASDTIKLGNWQAAAGTGCVFPQRPFSQSVEPHQNPWQQLTTEDDKVFEKSLFYSCRFF